MTIGNRSQASFQILSYYYHRNIDHIVGIVRVHPEGGDYKDNSPYSWAATVEVYGDKAWLLGVTKPPKPSECRELRRLLRSIGVSRVHFERHNKRTRKVEKSI